MCGEEGEEVAVGAWGGRGEGRGGECYAAIQINGFHDKRPQYLSLRKASSWLYEGSRAVQVLLSMKFRLQR